MKFILRLLILFIFSIQIADGQGFNYIKNENKKTLLFYSFIKPIKVKFAEKEYSTADVHFFQKYESDQIFEFKIDSNINVKIDGSYIRNFFIFGNLGKITNSDIPWALGKNGDFSENDYFYSYLPKPKKHPKKLNILFEEPILAIPSDVIIGKTKNQAYRSVSGKVLYDPILGSKKNIANAIIEVLDNQYFYTTYKSNSPKIIKHASALTYIKIKPTIKYFYFNHFKSSDNYYSSKPSSITATVEMDWNIILGKDTIEKIGTKVISTIDTHEPKKAFEAILKQSAYYFCQTDSLFEKFVSYEKRQKSITTLINVLPKYVAATTQKLDAKTLVKNSIPAVVTIHDLKEKSFGSGFIINSQEGYVLTGYHVIQDVAEPKIQFNKDTGKYPVEVVLVHENLDVALLRFSKKDVKEIALAQADTMEIGENIFAIGTPGDLLLTQSVSKGIVSGFREIEGKKYIQSDVSVSPGNSGGPIINENGEVIGIVLSKYIQEGVEGLSFAIPINKALEALGLKTEKK